MAARKIEKYGLTLEIWEKSFRVRSKDETGPLVFLSESDENIAHTFERTIRLIFRALLKNMLE